MIQMSDARHARVTSRDISGFADFDNMPYVCLSCFSLDEHRPLNAVILGLMEGLIYPLFF
jgi:hypothetical protein